MAKETFFMSWELWQQMTFVSHDTNTKPFLFALNPRLEDGSSLILFSQGACRSDSSRLLRRFGQAVVDEPHRTKTGDLGRGKEGANQ